MNLVAKELMQKTDVHNWMYRVSKGVTTPVCLGRANDRIFLTVAGIGVDSMVVQQVTPKEKNICPPWLMCVRADGCWATRCCSTTGNTAFRS